MVARPVSGLTCARRPFGITLDANTEISAKTIVIAAGAEYRRLSVENPSRFDGAGVYYSATAMEAKLCVDEEVVVVGGGNSAGQAAMFLAQTARRVYLLVRSGGLAESMSRYLIRRIELHQSIELRFHTQITALEGERQLEQVTWRDASTSDDQHCPIRHVFVMAGALPNTRWLEGCVAPNRGSSHRADLAGGPCRGELAPGGAYLLPDDAEWSVRGRARAQRQHEAHLIRRGRGLDVGGARARALREMGTPRRCSTRWKPR
jgi:thioredoxin reductase (NADPH)